MFKILQARLQQYMNHGLPDVQAGFRKGRGTEIKLPTPAGSLKKQEFQKNICFCFIDYAKALLVCIIKKLWKILKKMWIPDHLTCLLRNLYAGQEATVRTGHGTTDWFQIRKGVCQGFILSSCLNAGLDEAQTGIKIAWRNNNNLRYAEDTTLMAESEELKSLLGEGEVAQSCPTLCDPVDCNLLGFSVHGILQARILEWIAISFSRGSSQPRDRIRVSHIGGRRFNLLMKVKEESGKVGLKLSIQKTKIMASGPITSWQIDGETKETVRDFIFLGSKITADGDCSREIKRRLFLRRKAMTKLDSILKSRDNTLLNKGLSSQCYGFSSSHVWMWELGYKDSWVLNNWCFWTMVLEKTLESPLDSKGIKPVNPEWNQDWIPLEGLMLKLKLQ